MNVPTHTPYDGSSRLFTIGVKPLDYADWLEVDGDYDRYIAEKRRLYRELPADVFVEEAGTRAAQQEVLDLIRAYLEANAERLSATLDSRPGFPACARSTQDDATSPLKAASLLVQEDLILMRRGEDGWRLAAGSLCFPSSWSLIEKFGKPLHLIHDPVPGFGPGTRMADLIARMFDNLQGQGVHRFNWSMQAHDDLYYPLSNAQRDVRAATRPSKFANDPELARAFIRVERQTLRKLPLSGDILFTIRVYLDPLAAIARHPDGTTIATTFADQLLALDEAQLNYKGLTADRDRLVEKLKAIAKAR